LTLQQFKIDEYDIGSGAPPLFLPDIGTFFDQDMALAERMVRQLKEAGVEVLKGEVLHRADICLDDDTIERYYDPDNGMIEERWRELIERKVIPLDDYARIFGLCRDLGMPFVLSVYDMEGADFAKDIGAAGLKIASSNIVHQPLIEHVAGLGLPMLIDTGRSDIEEIARAMVWARDADAMGIVLQHSPPAPPAATDLHDLRMLGALSAMFDCPTGLSDHHAGDEMMYAAVALGTAVIEKGICLDHAGADIDVAHALPISQVAEVMAKCKRIHGALGQPLRLLRRNRERYSQRMGLIARTDIAPGSPISFAAVDFAWPAKGVGCEHWDIVRTWKTRTTVAKGQPIYWSDVEPA
jgi:sialic acid synthase SpsE